MLDEMANDSGRNSYVLPYHVGGNGRGRAVERKREVR
jgi:hypothetical protein